MVESAFTQSHLARPPSGLFLCIYVYVVLTGLGTQRPTCFFPSAGTTPRLHLAFLSRTWGLPRSRLTGPANSREPCFHVLSAEVSVSSQSRYECLVPSSGSVAFESFMDYAICPLFPKAASQLGVSLPVAQGGSVLSRRPAGTTAPRDKDQQPA